MATFETTKQSVIDAIHTKASTGELSGNDALALAKAVHALGSLSPTLADIQALAGSMLAAASVEAWLATPANKTALVTHLQIPVSAAYLAADSACIAALLASASACALLWGYKESIAAIAASSVAITALGAAGAASWAALGASPIAVAMCANNLGFVTNITSSASGMAGLLGSNACVDAFVSVGVFRVAVWNSDTAIAALQAAPTAVQRLIESGRAQFGTYASSSYTFANQGTRVVLLRRWYSTNVTSELDYLNWNRTTGNAAAPNGAVFYGITAAGRTATYASDGIYPTANAQAANLVLACNGLQRASWSQGATLSLYYLVV